MSSIPTTVARVVMAALLGLAACLVVWWPQGASGSERAAEAAGSAAVTALNLATPTAPTRTPGQGSTSPGNNQPSQTAPTAPGHAPTQAPPPAPMATGQGGHSGNGGHTGSGQGHQTPTLHADPQHGSGQHPGHQAVVVRPGQHPQAHHQAGGSSHQGSTSTFDPTSATSYPPASSTGSTGSGTATRAGGGGRTEPAHSAAVRPSPTATDSASTSASTSAPASPDSYLTSSEPVETPSTPVWIIPGILLVITSMLALLGGLLGRNRSAPDLPEA